MNINHEMLLGTAAVILFGGFGIYLELPPLLLPIPIFGSVLIVFWLGHLSRPKLKLYQCPQCHYDLRGVESQERCPECGKAYPLGY